MSFLQDATCKNECDICKLKVARNDAVSTLLREFELDPHWNKQKVQELSKQIGIPEIRIYKWNWDRKKKANFY